MIRHCKQPILVMENSPLFVQQKATSEHNEITVIIADFAIPLRGIFKGDGKAISPNIVEEVLKGMSGFPNVGLHFNYNRDAPAFLFRIKAMTERRRNDIHNQELANRIVVAKANARACIVGKRVLKSIKDYFQKEIESLTTVSDIFNSYAAREKAYVHKM